MSTAFSYYVMYDEDTIFVCSSMDEVCEALAGGYSLYGFTQDEKASRQLMLDCYHSCRKNN